MCEFNVRPTTGPSSGPVPVPGPVAAAATVISHLDGKGEVALPGSRSWGRSSAPDWRGLGAPSGAEASWVRTNANFPLKSGIWTVSLSVS